MSIVQIITLIVVMIVYGGVAIGRIPNLRMNRATITLVGAAVLVGIGGISEHDAIASLDMGTILLLGAMMVINVNLRMAGFFRFVASRTLRLARTPRVLLALVVASSGGLSALFLNDTLCLMLTPLILDLTLRMKRDPIPYLIGLAVAANVGSVATITGNPQNLIIGQASGIPYLTFAAYLAPIALMGLFICWGVIVLAFPAEFKGNLPNVELPPPHPYAPLLVRTLTVTVALMLAFFVGVSVVTAACCAAAALLISRLRPRKLLALDWELLAFFAGLFVVTGALETSGISERIFDILRPTMTSGIPAFTLVTAVLSNLISNVPAVLLLQTEIGAFADTQQAWLVLAMASTLAGNFTLLGSAATLIVAEVAAGRKTELAFMSYLRVGIPITLLTLAVGMAWLTMVT
jgi:Na+/H+ antiporter NhaD/arsenite permease-like protein